ncbi:hypothetical protein [Solibacillus isronensis]|uniref:hypothetical protein n=1 Tax=Solibacillus isronensis TaxID=412383 RepID=UPI0039A18E0A
MSFELGQKVKFTHSLKSTGRNVDSNIEYMDEKLYNQLCEDWVNIRFKERVEHKEMQGIIVGKRRITTNGRFTINTGEYGGEYLEKDIIQMTIFLVACNLSGFKRVFPEDIRIVG